MPPLFVSHRRLSKYKKYKRAKTQWSLDSGGFTELTKFGGWKTGPEEYLHAVRRYTNEIGSLAWAAPQDWMCEPWLISKTGLTVEEHQRRTIESVKLLRSKAPEIWFIPVLQGWRLSDYERHLRMYGEEGFDLTKEAVVGLGSVCRRQATGEIKEIVEHLHAYDIKIHGFGVKTKGISEFGKLLASADSMAWAYVGRYTRPCPVTDRKSCSDCLHHALEWREKVIAGMTPTLRGPLFQWES